MSDKPISVGDLVCVVYPEPCGCTLSMDEIGIHATVTKLRDFHAPYCLGCGARFVPGRVAFLSGKRGGFALYRLKRLDPDALKDDVPTREELHA